MIKVRHDGRGVGWTMWAKPNVDVQTLPREETRNIPRAQQAAQDVRPSGSLESLMKAFLTPVLHDESCGNWRRSIGVGNPEVLDSSPRVSGVRTRRGEVVRVPTASWRNIRCKSVRRCRGKSTDAIL